MRSSVHPEQPSQRGELHEGHDHTGEKHHDSRRPEPHVKEFEDTAPDSQRCNLARDRHGHHRKKVGERIQNHAREHQSEDALAPRGQVEFRSQSGIRFLTDIFAYLLEEQTAQRQKQNEHHALVPSHFAQQIETHHRHETSDEKDRHEIPRRKMLHNSPDAEIAGPRPAESTRRENVGREQQGQRRRQNCAEKNQGCQRSIVLRDQTLHPGDDVVRLLSPRHIERHDGKNIRHHENNQAGQRNGQAVLPRRINSGCGQQFPAARAAQFLSAHQLAMAIRRLTGVARVPIARQGNRDRTGDGGSHSGHFDDARGDHGCVDRLAAMQQ